MALHGEAMQTFRAIMSAVVPSATALLAGTVAIGGFAFGDDGNVNAWLLLLSAVPMVAMALLFDRWRWFTRKTLSFAKEVEPELVGVDGLAARLVDWMGEEPDPSEDRSWPQRVFDWLAPKTGDEGETRRSVLLRSPLLIAGLIALAAAGFGFGGP